MIAAAAGFRRTTAVIAAALVLAGCGGASATVPTSGPIEQGDRVASRDGGDQFIRVIPKAPVPGMTREQVVQGFLDASASFDGDHAVARQYLTPGASVTWDPSAGVLVYDGALNVDSASLAQIDVRGLLAGTISRDGRFETTAPGREMAVEFGLTSVDGEWRIERVPPGLVLGRSDVDRAFRTYDIYFFDPDFKVLVPDPRTIPVLGTGLATSLVSRLLDGPTAWLEPAVRTAFPQGTSLPLEAVPVESGVARVDLSVGVRAVGDEALQALSAQLVWTLGQLPDVTSVEIRAGGQPLVAPNVSARQPIDSWPDVSPDLMAVDATGHAIVRGRVVSLDNEGTGARPVQGDAGRGIPPLVDVAVSPDGSAFAGLDKRRRLWTSNVAADMELRIAEGQLARPSIDRDGTAWTVDPAGVVYAVDALGEVSVVTVAGLPARSQILRIVVARDGVRAALVVAAPDATVVMVGRITRGTDGTLTVSAPQRVEQRLSGVVDLSWNTADSLVVLGVDGAGPAQVFDLSIPRGSLRVLGGPGRPGSVAAAPGLPILVSSSDGFVYESSYGLWNKRVKGGSPAYPG